MKRILFELEKRFGDISSLADRASRRVIVTNNVCDSVLNDLFTNKAAAVHVKNFVPDANRKSCIEKIQEAQEKRRNWSVSHRSRGQEISDVDSIGTPYNVANAEGEQSIHEYFKSSLDFSNLLRGKADVNTQLSPLDQLRLELDESWRDGCRISTDEKSGSKFSPGICRIMKPGFTSASRGFIHVDDLNILNDSKGLFSYNIYLQQPEIGGEINIWPVSIRSRWDFYRNASILSLFLVQDKQAQDFLYSHLPAPVTVAVEEGDLILLNTQRPHAVKKPLIGSKERLSIQGFIQYESGQPLLLEV